MDFFLVDVDTINCTIPYSEIKDNEMIVNRLANIILESGGIVNPLFVKKLGFDSYELVYGDVEYYAAVKASQIDPRKGEMIAAFIIKDEQKDAIKRQIDVLRKTLSNIEQLGDNQPSINQVICTASDNYSKLNSVEKDIKQIHEQLDYFMEINTPKGIKKLLTKQLETIISETENKTKQEAIQHLRKAQHELQQYQKNIENEILELSKFNLIDVTYDELAQIMKQVGSSVNQINASWKAIEYWRKPDKELSWDNLKKSTINKSKDKIYGFAQAAYAKLRKVAYL
ncbi:chromosome partitioning protein ParB [Crocosphaera sp. UHCC 0190]|uniref:chromosome partitioning protein ParB n=1 Tax=Crocosphaera sp. UHCC 0190 TaxID=3110246 RepID=UPI002B20015E|nr:chromosome partitioning protein ParB [Crocosphaera sp. UHCC 0190]MEA5511648.1 chromosome partitioning protein ParB [Crocosphaera sp. UHCC 0190]